MKKLLFLSDFKGIIKKVCTIVFLIGVLAGFQVRIVQANPVAPKILPTGENDKDIRLILVGIVMHIKSYTPLNNINVELKDNLTGDVRDYTTKEDGQFTFKLKQDRQYTVYHTDKSGIEYDSRIISTIGKNNPEILYAMLEGPLPLPDDKGKYEVDRDKPKAGANYDLTYKIQIGTFKTPPASGSDFFKNLNRTYETEKDGSWIKYMVGKYKTLDKAKAQKMQLTNDGYKPFIVYYCNGIRYNSYKEAMEKCSPPKKKNN